MNRQLEIVGYVWQADTWCPHCIRIAPFNTAEDGLDALATLIRLGDPAFDRYNESSFESDNFPKIISYLEEFEHVVYCAGCDEEMDCRLYVNVQSWGVIEGAIAHAVKQFAIDPDELEEPDLENWFFQSREWDDALHAISEEIGGNPPEWLLTEVEVMAHDSFVARRDSMLELAIAESEEQWFTALLIVTACKRSPMGK